MNPTATDLPPDLEAFLDAHVAGVLARNVGDTGRAEILTEERS